MAKTTKKKAKKMDLDTFKQQKADLQAQISKHGKKMLATEFNQFFEANPTVEAVQWTQYTPYFNDGDSCEFGRNDMSIKISGKIKVVNYKGEEQEIGGDEGGNDDDGFIDQYELCSDRNKDPGTAALGKALKKLETALSDIDDIFLDTFGDHVEVTCTRNGFDVEEYSHD